MIEKNVNEKFWSEGNGKDFIEWTGKSVQAGNYDSALFYAVDEKVDTLVHKWLRNGEIKSIMSSLHQKNIEDLPQDFIELRNELEEKPAWLNEDLMAKGCELSERSGLVGLLVLRNFALLGGYNFANLTKPLVATGALEKGAVQRLFYTLNFWVNVSRTSEDAQELRMNACIRTRLVHCMSRLMIQRDIPDWNVEEYGVPINYADMVATNIAFTVYFLFGLDQLNFKYSSEEEEGLFHLWKYVTYLLGVPVKLIPENRIEALRFFKFWTKYQAAPDEDSFKLTQALLKENTPLSLLKLDVIKRNMGYIHGSISNYLIDEEIRRNLGIHPVRLKNVVPTALKLKNEIQVDKEKQIRQGNLEQRSVLNDYSESVS